MTDLNENIENKIKMNNQISFPKAKSRKRHSTTTNASSNKKDEKTKKQSSENNDNLKKKSVSKKKISVDTTKESKTIRKSVKKSVKKSVGRKKKDKMEETEIVLDGVSGIEKTMFLNYNYSPLNENEIERKTALSNCFVIYGPNDLIDELMKLLEKNKTNASICKNLKQDIKWFKSKYKKFFSKN